VVLFVNEMDGNFGGQRINRKCSYETVKTSHNVAECWKWPVGLVKVKNTMAGRNRVGKEIILLPLEPQSRNVCQIKGGNIVTYQKKVV